MLDCLLNFSEKIFLFSSLCKTALRNRKKIRDATQIESKNEKSKMRNLQGVK